MPQMIKLKMLDEMRRELAGLDGCVCIDYRGVPAESVREFRRTLDKSALSLLVVRNALAQKAIADGPLAGASKFVEGPTGLIYGRLAEGGSAIVAARVLVEWNRKKKDAKFPPRGALNDGELFPADKVPALAKLPDRKTLRGMLAGGVIGAARGLAVATAGVAGGLARCLQARIDKGGAGGGDGAPAAS